MKYNTIGLLIHAYTYVSSKARNRPEAKKKEYKYKQVCLSSIPDGLGVRIPGFHPGGPGSIPGLGDFSPALLLKIR